MVASEQPIFSAISSFLYSPPLSMRRIVAACNGDKIQDGGRLPTRVVCSLAPHASCSLICPAPTGRTRPRVSRGSSSPRAPVCRPRPASRALQIDASIAGQFADLVGMAVDRQAELPVVPRSVACSPSTACGRKPASRRRWPRSSTFHRLATTLRAPGQVECSGESHYTFAAGHLAPPRIAGGENDQFRAMQVQPHDLLCR